MGRQTTEQANNWEEKKKKKISAGSPSCVFPADPTHLRGPRPNLLRQSASPGDGGSARPAAALPPAADIPAPGEVDKGGGGVRLLPFACDRGLDRGGGVVGEAPGSEPLGVSLVGDGGSADCWRLGGESATAVAGPSFEGLFTLYLSSMVSLGLRSRFGDLCTGETGTEGKGQTERKEWWIKSRRMQNSGLEGGILTNARPTEKNNESRKKSLARPQTHRAENAQRQLH